MYTLLLVVGQPVSQKDGRKFIQTFADPRCSTIKRVVATIPEWFADCEPTDFVCLEHCFIFLTRQKAAAAAYQYLAGPMPTQ
jgi:hypothetical protein